jgi:Leucine-rich repeat (LRR) protein
MSEAKTIDLRGLGLTSIPQAVLEDRSVCHLWLGLRAQEAGPRGPDLYANALTELPDAIGGMSGLRSLDLGGNPITDMVATFRLLARLPELRELDLQMTGLRALPNEVSLLRGMEKLQLGSNMLGSLGESICALTELRDLSAECCELRELPRGLAAWKKLRRLYLFSNGLTELPSTIGELSALRELDVTRNQLRRVPPELDRMALRRISLGGNPLDENERHRLRAVFGRRVRLS